jgi:hypothetical protein
MPFLDAKALETDPEGLAFLRLIISPPPDAQVRKLETCSFGRGLRWPEILGGRRSTATHLRRTGI